MRVGKHWLLQANLVFVSIGAALGMVGCASPGLPPGAVGNPGQYNYSPSVIQNGNTVQFWWCSPGTNPNDTSQTSDAIYYASMQLPSQITSNPIIVLAETPGAWDSVYTCNPKVIGGKFSNPLGDGQTYTYAMYYAGTNAVSGVNNSIGVAFSNDGINWKKYPQPVINSTDSYQYGVGQPSLYNTDKNAAITMFYEDTFPTLHHAEADSSDGVHFQLKGSLTTSGLDPDDPNPSWGDMSFDSQTGEWYAVFNRPLRPSSTTGNVLERGQSGVELYKIPQSALLTGSSPWQQLAIMDTNSTGFEANFIAGFVHDMYGNVNVGAYPKIKLYTSISYPRPDWNSSPSDAASTAAVTNWILYPMTWDPIASPALPINSYYNGTVHDVTTGWVSTDGGFKLQGPMGHLYANPQQGATLPFYGCKSGQTDYFVSLDINCEGEFTFGKNGYGYAQPVSGLNLQPLYRCSTGSDHFVSNDPKCGGATTDQLLGYVAP